MNDILNVIDKFKRDKELIDSLNTFLMERYNDMIKLKLSRKDADEFLRRCYDLNDETICFMLDNPDTIHDMINPPQTHTYDDAYNEFKMSVHGCVINNSSFDIYKINNTEVLDIFKELCTNKKNRCSIDGNKPVRITSDKFDNAIRNHKRICVYSKTYLRKHKEEA